MKDLDNFEKEYMDKWIIELPNRVRRIVQKTVQSIQYDLKNCAHIPLIPNLLKQERTAFRLLKKNDNIVISKSDKGYSVVILPTAKYLGLVHQHLKDETTYQVLNEVPMQEICQQYIQYLTSWKERGVITAKQFDDLKPPKNVETQIMYFLPKLHKRQLKHRPIVASTNGPTQTASAYIDRLFTTLHEEGSIVYSQLNGSDTYILKTLEVPSQTYT